MKKHGFAFYLLSAVAVLALTAASMAVGALAFPREIIVEVPKEVPVKVEVPVEQEAIVMEEIGLTLILPDSWKGRYVVEYHEDGTYTLYNKCVYDRDQIEHKDGSVSHGGVLFWFNKLNEAYTPQETDEFVPVPYRYLFVTTDATYLLYYASDVQYDLKDPEQEEDYLSMFHQISEIQVVLDNAFAQSQGGGGGL